MAPKKWIDAIQAFTDGVNTNIEVDEDLYVEVWEENHTERSMILTLSSSPAIQKVPVESGFVYQVQDLDVSDFDTSDAILKWYANKDGSPIAEYPVTREVDIVNAPSDDFLNIIDHYPDDSDQDINPQSVVWFQFDQPIDTDSVNSSTVMVYEARTNIPVDAMISVSGSVVRVSAIKEMDPLTGYIAVIVGQNDSPKNYIVSTGGGVLQDSYSFSFKTGDDEYAKITDVTSPRQLERVAPVRLAPTSADDPSSSSLMEFVKSEPTSGTFNNDIDTIKIHFSENVDSSSLVNINIEQENIFGIDDYYSENNTLGSYELPVFTAISYGKTIELVPDKDILGNTLIIIEGLDMIEDESANMAFDAPVLQFTTKSFPMFTSSQIVTLEVGEYINNIPSYILGQMVLKNSIEAYEQYSGHIKLNNSIDPDLRTFVKWKTVVDAIESLTLSTDKNVQKTLSYLTVSYTGSNQLRLKGRLQTARKEMERSRRRFESKHRTVANLSSKSNSTISLTSILDRSADIRGSYETQDI